MTAGLPQVTEVGGATLPAGTAPVLAGGDTARVEVAVRNDGVLPVLAPKVALAASAGWSVRPLDRAPAVLAPGRSTTLAFTVGLPAATAPGAATLTATTSYDVIGKGRQQQRTSTALFDSGAVTRDAIRAVDVDLTGVRVLDLVVGDGGDGGYNDRADWAASTSPAESAPLCSASS